MSGFGITMRPLLGNLRKFRKSTFNVGSVVQFNGRDCHPDEGRSSLRIAQKVDIGRDALIVDDAHAAQTGCDFVQ